MFQIYHYIVFLYVAVRFVMPLPWRVGWKVGLLVFLLPVSQHHQIYRLLFGTMFSPEFPRPLVIFIGWSYGTLVLLFILTVLLDVLGGITALIRRKALTPVNRSKCRYVVAAVAVSLCSFGISQAIRVPNVKQVVLNIRNLRSRS